MEAAGPPLAATAEPPTATEPDSELIEDLVDGEETLTDEEIDLPSGPLLAPTHGAEELTRTEDVRIVRAEIQGRREDRGRRRRGRERERRGERPSGERPSGERPSGERPSGERHEARPEPRPEARPPAPPVEPRPPAPAGARPTLIDAACELLRQAGRPMHVRHLVDAALKRRLVDVRVPAPEVVRQMRAALIGELREREAEGLRPRLRDLGGGHFALVDRKLEPELQQAERELVERAQRLRDATRLALRRRLGRMSPPAFEALGRALLDKLGLHSVELVRRGEGVAYYGGQRPAGVGGVRTLVAMRPGEGEIGRYAVGELRAGLTARGFDEGLLLAGGRASAEALAELKGGAVTVHDGASLAALLIRHGLGVRRSLLPVEYLDLELFGELTEG
jgi:hypothetical protein